MSIKLWVLSFRGGSEKPRAYDTLPWSTSLGASYSVFLNTCFGSAFLVLESEDTLLWLLCPDLGKVPPLEI